VCKDATGAICNGFCRGLKVKLQSSPISRRRIISLVEPQPPSRGTTRAQAVEKTMNFPASVVKSIFIATAGVIVEIQGMAVIGGK
jgi:hypothetical protein